MPDIARATGTDEEDVRRQIVSVWLADKSAAKAARLEVRLNREE